MFKVASLIWIMLGTVLAGIATTVVLVVPQLAADSERMIPLAAIAGAVLGIPLSMLIAKRIQAQTVRTR
ncbi:MAG: hypothetical protein ABL893_02305 [Hyphomicrobium sp.]|nr:hypothetical protein [Hyphomicrobium sp.]